ncbi:hypothetical protein LF887_14620 [Chryseobacterium sp. MEBOG06]|uniref:hypothetical protein n=1 Tax=Chryseobacterium sp. MEBOG06 TaxID=2879938 RepID=UPI001F1C5749|nr:hypothetical protein [Chryseobacterium sp. MEBOG06]UKB82238.1 hypothetical protein LF887_14620 [Chryseobacterium sp. MEBOG06]
MRENTKKIKILIILFLLFTFNYSNAQDKGQKFLYTYLDKWKEDEGNFKFIQINLIVDCKNQLLFTVSKKDLIYYDEKKIQTYKTYKYKGMLIIYEIDDKIVNKKNINFFDKYLQSINYDIKMLPKGNQSLINGYMLYFKNNKLITNDKKIHYFMENNCKSLE